MLISLQKRSRLGDLGNWMARQVPLAWDPCVDASGGRTTPRRPPGPPKAATAAGGSLALSGATETASDGHCGSGGLEVSDTGLPGAGVWGTFLSGLLSRFPRLRITFRIS